MTKSIVDLTGQKFDYWTVESRDAAKNGLRESYWICECKCGAVRSIRRSKLIRGESKSCGCKRAKTRENHGLSNSREYKIWAGMKKRCENPASPNWDKYGGVGIKVCERWSKSFLAFHEDMGPSPSRDHSIDRIDNALGYFKENCRWATKKEQAINRKSTIYLELHGEKKIIQEWIEIYDAPTTSNLVIQRLKRGFPLLKALLVPPDAYFQRGRLR
jgi:hypothetical protein